METVLKQKPDEEWFFQCQKCGAMIQSSEHTKIPIPPSECYEHQGGCGRKSKFVDKTHEVLHRRIKKLEEELKKKK